MKNLWTLLIFVLTGFCSASVYSSDENGVAVEKQEGQQQGDKSVKPEKENPKASQGKRRGYSK